MAKGRVHPFVQRPSLRAWHPVIRHLDRSVFYPFTIHQSPFTSESEAACSHIYLRRSVLSSSVTPVLNRRAYYPFTVHQTQLSGVDKAHEFIIPPTKIVLKARALEGGLHENIITLEGLQDIADVLSIDLQGHLRAIGAWQRVAVNAQDPCIVAFHDP